MPDTSIIFAEGYYPVACVSGAGLEYHYSLTSDTSGSTGIQGKILGPGGQVVVAPFAVLPASTGIKADQIAVSFKNGTWFLSYRKSSDSSIVTVQSTDGRSFV